MRNIFKVIKLEPVELSCWLKVNQVLLRAQWDLQLEVYVTSAARRRYLFKLCQTRTFTFKDQSFHCWDQSEKTTFHSSNEHPPLPISTVVELESGTFSLMLLLSSSPMLHPAYIFISTFRNKYIYMRLCKITGRSTDTKLKLCTNHPWCHTGEQMKMKTTEHLYLLLLFPHVNLCLTP